MELKKENWTKNDINEFEEYLISFSKGKEKGEWEKRIINTAMPCIAVPSPEVKRITNEIAKGNFIEYLNLWIWNNFTETSIIGGLICKLKDFNLFENYLDKYINNCDNWATCDLLKFPIKNSEDGPFGKANFFNLANKYIKSNHTFARRLGVTILFKLVDDDKYIDKIFDILDTFEKEEEYYVNMVCAWLVAECFTKQRDKTLEYLKRHKLNKFTINKSISKCRDSFRISKEDKEMLVKFRQ